MSFMLHRDASGDLGNGNTVTLFEVTGCVRVTTFIGIVTEDFSMPSSSKSVGLVFSSPTVGDVAGAGRDVTHAKVGHLLGSGLSSSFGMDFGAAIPSSAAFLLLDCSIVLEWFGSVAATSGAIRWVLEYQPVEPGSKVEVA